MSWEFAAKSLAEDVPGFEIVRETGEGANGRVFVARQTALDRLVALKFLATASDYDPEERIARFRREAAIMAALKHPNVLPVYDFGEDDGRFFLVMEYVESGDLRKHMPVGRGMSPVEAMAVLLPVGEALDYLHGQGILHRDLKPENILMQGGVPKVADFGIAVERAGSGELTRSGQGLGTLGYVAPELQYRLPVDERADQYSLAAMAYELLTGVRPLGVFKAPSFHNPCLCPEVDRVLMRALEESPGDRYPTVLGFVHALRDSFEAKVSHPPKSPGIGKRTRLALVSVGLLILAVGAAALLRQPPPTEGVRPFEDTQTLHALTRWRAHQIWLSQACPVGEVGAAVAPYNWNRAKSEVEEAVDNLAATIRAERPPHPPKGMSQEEADRSILTEARRRLYREWHVDPSVFVAGKDGPKEGAP